MLHCQCLQSQIPMCPCSKGSDVPQNEHDSGMENNQNLDQVENVLNVVVSGDSGSDEEIDNFAAQGYISLAQNEDDAAVDGEIEQAEQEVCTDNADDLQTETPQDDNGTVAEASASTAFSSTQNTQMGEDEINLIKSVMMNIQLPSSAIPEWAKKIPEEKWKQPLVSALQQRTNRNNENKDKMLNTSNDTV